jgi:hypothetical protein
MLNVKIRIRGRLDPEWADWLQGLAIDYVGKETVLSGCLPDQAGVYGVIGKLRDLGVSLISVQFSDETLNNDQAPGGQWGGLRK